MDAEICFVFKDDREEAVNPKNVDAKAILIPD
jgi:hypothetical protein